MISYLVKSPKITSILSLSGIILAMYGLGMFSGFSLPNAQALDCNSAGAPTIPSNQGYATNWRVQNWLTFNNIPIGPSTWVVAGRVQEGANQNCFLETWNVNKVVFESSRNSARGQIIDRNDPVAVNQHRLNFFESTTINSGNPNYYAAYRLNTGGAAQDWSPLGLYGLLKSDKDGLDDSRGYLPVEWQVNGSF